MAWWPKSPSLQQAVLQHSLHNQQQQALAALYQAQATAPMGGGWVTNTVVATVPTMTTPSSTNSWVTMPMPTQTTSTAGLAYWQPDDYPGRKLNTDITVHDGEELIIHLPDGTHVVVNKDGSFAVNDKDSKIVYRANRTRDFNSFINASDKLEAFIKFCGALGVKQDEMLNIPVKHFIAWLVIEAARADGEEPNVDLLEGIHAYVRPRCRCGRFIARKLVARKIAFCRSVCLERELAA